MIYLLINHILNKKLKFILKDKCNIYIYCYKYENTVL
jgi:hypothetical protein